MIISFPLLKTSEVSSKMPITKVSINNAVKFMIVMYNKKKVRWPNYCIDTDFSSITIIKNVNNYLRINSLWVWRSVRTVWYGSPIYSNTTEMWKMVWQKMPNPRGPPCQASMLFNCCCSFTSQSRGSTYPWVHLDNYYITIFILYSFK